MVSDLQRMAHRVTDKIDNYIFDEYGIKTIMSAEIEMVVYPKNKAEFEAHKQAISEIMGVNVEENKEYSYLPAKDKKEIHRVKFFENSAKVTNLYQENGKDQYEIVMSHLAEGQTPAKLINAINMAKKRLVRKLAEHGLGACFDANSPYIIKRHRSNVDAQAGYVINVGNSLHLSHSFNNKNKNNRNIFGYHKESIYPWERAKKDPSVDIMASLMLDILNETVIMFAPNDESYRRFKRDTDSFPSMMKSSDYRLNLVHYKRDNQNAKRLENRLAGVDADPYMAIAGNMVAICYALESRFLSVKNDKLYAENYRFETSYKFPKDRAEAVGRFSDGYLFEQTLDQVEQGLGREFKNSITQDIAKAKDSFCMLR